MDRRRVVITGAGIVSSIGVGKEAFWKSSLEGRSGVSAVSGFDASGIGSRIWGRVTGFDPEGFVPPHVLKRVDPFVHFAIAAARMALSDSGLDLERENRDRIGVIIGSGLGGIVFHEQQMERALRIGLERINPLGVPRTTPNSVSSQVAITFNLTGPVMVISNACASGTNAVGEALRKVQFGEVDLALAGGSEAAITPFTLAAYDAMGVLSRKNDHPENASRPFDRERDGFVLGEGAAVLVVEEEGHARRRGARVYAELGGYAANSGAYHMVMPRPDGVDIASAMAGALRDARADTGQVDYINAHGTGTMQNDRVETAAIKKVFGARAYSIPVSSTKSMIGHTIGASGAIEALVCCLAISEGTIPPTINYRNRDPECDLDYVPNEPRKATLGAVISNSFGFGSNNACLLLRRYDG